MWSQPQPQPQPPRPGDLAGRPVLADRARELAWLARLVREHVLEPSGVEAYDFRFGYVYDRGFELDSFAEVGCYSLDYGEGYWPLERLAGEVDAIAVYARLSQQYLSVNLNARIQVSREVDHLCSRSVQNTSRPFSLGPISSLSPT